jgi:hypothetical protein
MDLLHVRASRSRVAFRADALDAATAATEERLMSHPLNVPHKWKRGEPLELIGRGPRYALAQKLDLTAPVGEDFVADEIFAITFDSAEDVNKFLEWWGADWRVRVQS